MPLVIAHRGASAYELENSMAAFQRAVQLGADGVELDVHVTADGVPIVHHDPVADGRTLRRSRQADLEGIRLENGEPLPTLSEALTAIGDHHVFVEAKHLPPEHDAALLSALAAGPHPERYQVHAFDHRVVRRLRATHAAPPCGILSTSYPVDPLAQLRAADAGTLWQHESMVDAALVDLLHEAGIRVYAWTVDVPERLRALCALGVDGLCTNTPDTAREVLG